MSFIYLFLQYHTEGNRVQFYIDDSSTAYALVKVSRKITDKDGYKVQCYKIHVSIGWNSAFVM